MTTPRTVNAKEIAPIRIRSKLLNNRMIRARERLSMTAPQIAKAMGLSYVQWIELESLRRSPLRADGQWRKVALRISDWLKMMPNDLWPAESIGIEQRTAEIEASAVDAYALIAKSHYDELPDYQHELDHAELNNAVQSLPDKHREVISLRFGLNGDEHASESGLTTEEIAERMGYSRCRIWQLEREALIMLGHPSKWNDSGRFYRICVERQKEDRENELVSWGHYSHLR